MQQKNPKIWEVKAEMREKGMLLKVDLHFNLADSTLARKSVLGQNAMKDFPHKKHL